VSTCEELQYYINRWTQSEYDSYPILYLGFHGTRGNITLRKFNSLRSSKVEVGLDTIIKPIGERADNRWIHFGSCSTVDVHGGKINNLLKNTGILGISGFKKEVDWVHSYLLELAFFSRMAQLKSTPSGLREIETFPKTRRKIGEGERRAVQGIKKMKESLGLSIRINSRYK